MKRSVILLFAFLTVFFYSCKDEDKTVSVVGVTINTPSKVTLSTGESLNLSAVVTPENASRKDLLWVSNRPDIATVNSESGLVNAVFHGEVKITVTSKQGYVTDAVTLTILPAVYTTGVEIKQDNVTIAAKDTIILDYEVLPSNATDKGVIWTSSNPAAATVAVIDGKVTLAGIAHGTTTITVTTREGAHMASIDILVTPKAGEEVIPTGVTLPDVVGLEEGSETRLTPIFTPPNATIKERFWESDNPEVAEVDQNGVVKAISLGEANITFTAEDYEGNSVSTSCEIHVVVFVTALSLNLNWASLEVGETVILAAMIEPEEATNKNLTWKSDNPEIAEVTIEDDKVIVTGKATGANNAPGKTKITATSAYGEVSVSCDITVTKPEE